MKKIIETGLEKILNYIIVDTNMFYLNFYMESIEWKKLLWLNKQEDFKIICPEFIFEEVIKKYSDVITAPLNELKALKKDKSFKFLSIDIQDAKKVDYTEKYRKNFRHIFLDNGVDIIPYPKNENYLKLIAEKYFKSKRPFRLEKQSFPDAIIWYSIFGILKTIGSTEKIHFITANYKDFSQSKENKDVFHEDYIEELTNKEKANLFLHENISAFISSQIEVFEELSNENRENFKQQLKEKIESEISTFNDISTLLEVSIDESDIQEVIEWGLLNCSLEGEYIYGWGEDVELDSDIRVADVIVDFANDLEAELIVELNVYADYSIVGLNPMYEDPEDEEYLSESGYGSDFNVKTSFFFKIDDSLYTEESDYEKKFDNFVEKYLEIDNPKIELA